jgi:hypothetical protein
VGSDEDRDRSRRPGVENRGWSRWFWRCMQSTPCTGRWGAYVFWLSLKTKVDGLWVIWPQNHYDDFSRFGLKIDGKRFSRFGLKSVVEGFLVWVSKPSTTVWWFGPQNHRNGFLVWASKPSGLRFVGCVTKPTGGWDGAGHVLRSNSLLHVKASQTRLSQSGLKTDGVVVTGGARGTIAEVAWGSSRRRTSWCNELRETLLPLLCRFWCIRSYRHFSLLVGHINRTLNGWSSLPLLLLIF